jgi:hypothetical protein
MFQPEAFQDAADDCDQCIPRVNRWVRTEYVDEKTIVLSRGRAAEWFETIS